MEKNSNGHGNREHRRRWRWIIIVFVVVLAIWSFKWIWPGHRYDHHGRGSHHWMEISENEMKERMEHGANWAFKKLDTTDEQEEAIEEALEDLIPVIVKLKDEHLEIKEDFRQALERKRPDREELEELLEEGKVLMSEAMDEGLETFITIWETLTPEQREDVLEHWRER